jgi:hypothetical protein
VSCVPPASNNGIYADVPEPVIDPAGVDVRVISLAPKENEIPEPAMSVLYTKPEAPLFELNKAFPADILVRPVPPAVIAVTFCVRQAVPS